MLHRRLAAISAFTIAAWSFAPFVDAAGPPARKPLNAVERADLLSLLKAVDLAQETDVLSDAGVSWDSYSLKSAGEISYVPFTLGLSGLPDGFKSAAMYVRAVSRHDGIRSADERSAMRERLVRGDPPPPRSETVWVGPGEMPVGGPASSSARRSTQAPVESSTLLTLQQRQYEKQKAAEEEARKKAESKRRDPFLFPFEEYYFFELKSARTGEPRIVERALGLPPGDYDVYVGLLDRARVKTSRPVVIKHTLTVPDFWNDRLALSGLLLVNGVHVLKMPLAGQQQAEHPYTLGLTEMTPMLTRSFTPADPLSVVFQICNYGAPDSDLMVEYNFYRVENATRTLFNRTEPQRYTDVDLPPAGGW
ncbi:MAG: hypothetical protein HY047_02030, partial [Acidobacteria bacterium]|nr:hypothetical protein [Acidobacteriota bacterium]